MTDLDGKRILTDIAKKRQKILLSNILEDACMVTPSSWSFVKLNTSEGLFSLLCLRIQEILPAKYTNNILRDNVYCIQNRLQDSFTLLR